MVHGLSDRELRKFAGALRSWGGRGKAAEKMRGVRPFVTISRQAGAEGRLGALLAERLQVLEDWREGYEGGGRPQWQCMDRDLVERIASDQHVSARLIDALEASSHSFVMEFLRGLHFQDQGPPSDLTVVRRMAETMRGLAQAGHAILVGHGGIFMTRNMTGGIHVRLTAPREFRVRNFARVRGISEAAARRQVAILDQKRVEFYRTFWPHEKLSEDLFHVTLNASLLTEDQMADCVVGLVRPMVANEV